MKEHNFDFEWPPINQGILALCSLYEQKPSINAPRRRRGNYLIYWTIENGSIIWKDCHTKQSYFEVELEKWWELEY